MQVFYKDILTMRYVSAYEQVKFSSGKQFLLDNFINFLLNTVSHL